jgi:hypothetical protein
MKPAPFYVAETKLKNHLESPLKLSLGINPGRNAPLLGSAHGWRNEMSLIRNVA